MQPSFLHQHWTDLTTSQVIALVAIVAPAIMLVIAWTANRINKKNAARQIEVAERTLYLSLVEKRSDWLEEYREAVWAREKQVEDEPLTLMSRAFPPKAEGRVALARQTRKARWLFDERVNEQIDEVARWLDRKMEAQAELRTDPLSWDDAKRARDKEELMVAVHGLERAINDIADEMPRFMYVGDITRTVLKSRLERGWFGT